MCVPSGATEAAGCAISYKEKAMDPFVPMVCLHQLARPKRRIKMPGVGDCTKCTAHVNNMDCGIFKPVSVVHEWEGTKFLYIGRRSNKLREFKRRRGNGI